MPVSFANQLCGAPREAQNDLLEFPVFGLPDLKAVLEELLNIRIARSGAGKLTPYGTDVLHPGQDKNPASCARWRRNARTEVTVATEDWREFSS
jgi:hypothetical protein